MKYGLLVFLIITWLLGWAVAVEVLLDKYGHAPVSEVKANEAHALVEGANTSLLIRGVENAKQS